MSPRAKSNVIRFPRKLELVDLTVLQAHYGMSERWLRYRLAEGMPVHRFGRRLRFNIPEVDIWLGKRYPG